MIAHGIVLMNTENGELFCAFPLYYKFGIRPYSDYQQFSVYVEVDNPTPDAYSVQVDDEVMLVSKEILHGRIDSGLIEELGDL